MSQQPLDMTEDETQNLKSQLQNLFLLYGLFIFQ